MKKKFLSSFEPARVVKGADRWYILFYIKQPDSDSQKRYRLTFKLNRIRDLQEREKRARAIAVKINWWLGRGRSMDEFDERDVPGYVVQDYREKRPEQQDTSVLEALEFAIKLKGRTRKETHRVYGSVAKMFRLFLEKKRWADLMVGDVTKQHASAYMDHCIFDRDVGPYTYNNNLRLLRALFNVLLERSYVNENPFGELKFQKAKGKKRRNFSKEEAKVMARELYNHYPILFYAVLMQYCCFLRPNEIRSLQFKSINIKTGLIHLPGNASKNHEDRIVTIPEAFLPFFPETFFEEYPKNWFIFGRGLKPNAKLQCSHNALYCLHRRVLQDLYQRNFLDSIEGLSFYSWKDTGITDALDNINPLAVKDQAGHHDLKMTMRYRHKRKVNEQMKGFKNELL